MQSTNATHCTRQPLSDFLASVPNKWGGVLTPGRGPSLHPRVTAKTQQWRQQRVYPEPSISWTSPQTLRTTGGSGRGTQESGQLSVIYLPTGIFLLLPPLHRCARKGLDFSLIYFFCIFSEYLAMSVYGLPG